MQEAVFVARKTKKQRRQSREEAFEARLALIRKRHRELILRQRELIAADLASEFDDALDDGAELEELELAQAVQSETL
jgi:hypothetical protein